MKPIIFSLTCLAVLLANIARADDVPFFSPLREEIINQLTLATNTVPLNKKLVSALASNLKTLDKTKPTLITGSAALGTLAKSLGKTTLSNTFLPILTGTRTVYLDVIETAMGTLEERLTHTMPGKTQTSAQTAINKLAVALENATTNASFTLSLKSLSKAAKALAAADKAVFKAETAKPGASFLTATIIESNQGTNLLKVTKSTFLYATYDSFSGDVDIEAGELKKLKGGRVQGRGLSLTATPPGEGTHTLSLTNATEGYAYYQHILSPSMAEFEAEEPEFEFEELYLTVDPYNERLGTGTITITVDLEANVAWGTFTFTATGSDDSNLEVSMTGSFLVRLESYEEEDYEE